LKKNSTISDFLTYSLSELSQLIRAGKLTSFELVSSYFERIEKFNPKLNAIVFLNKEEALSHAKRADLALSQGEDFGVFHGIPITVKDNIEVENLPTTAGFTPFKNHISKSDAYLVSLLKQAGAIIIGKTNLPGLTYDIQTNNQLFGRTNNPWNMDHTSGGSSGGCASAVSSGMSKISLCNDSGGSIRIPAHFCGVYGFKASTGGVNPKGILTQIKKKAGPLKMRTLLSVGMMAQSVDDIKTIMSAVGKGKLTPSSKNQISPTSVRLLWIEELNELEVDHEIKSAFEKLRSTLTASGVSIDNFNLKQFDFLDAIKLWGHLSNYETGSELPPLTRSVGNIIMKRKYSKIPMYTDLLKPISSKRYKALRQKHEHLKQKFEDLLSSYDGLVIPASSVLAFPHQNPDRRIGHLGIYTSPLEVNGKPVQYAIAAQSYCLPFNVLESPVVSLPIALSKKNLPIGLQLVGKKNHDFDLLEVATTLDSLIPSIGKPKL
jgi:amidase